MEVLSIVVYLYIVYLSIIVNCVLLTISLLCIRCFCGCGEPCGRAVTKGERNNLRDVQSFSISMCIHSQYFLCNNSLYPLGYSKMKKSLSFGILLSEPEFSTLYCATFLDLRTCILSYSFPTLVCILFKKSMFKCNALKYLGPLTCLLNNSQCPIFLNFYVHHFSTFVCRQSFSIF